MRQGSNFPEGYDPLQKRWMPKWLKALIITLVLLASPLVVMQVSFVVATAPMVAIADDLYPDPGWKEDAHNVSGGPFCLGIDVPCDSMWRGYRTKQEITNADLQRISDGAGLGSKVEGNCSKKGTDPFSGMHEVCSISGVKDGYDVKVSVSTIVEGNPERIIYFKINNVKNRS